MCAVIRNRVSIGFSPSRFGGPTLFGPQSADIYLKIALGPAKRRFKLHPHPPVSRNPILRNEGLRKQLEIALKSPKEAKNSPKQPKSYAKK